MGIKNILFAQENQRMVYEYDVWYMYIVQQEPGLFNNARATETTIYGKYYYNNKMY